MDNELYHVSPNKGYAKKDHKYLSREWKNGRWNYQYEQPKNNASSGKSKDASAAAVRFIAKDAADKYKAKTGRKATSSVKNAGSAINKVGIGKNAVDAAKKASSAYNAKNQPKMSKEYLEELGYNSQKNDWIVSNTKKTVSRVDARGNAGRGVDERKQTTNTEAKKDDKSFNLLAKAKGVVDSILDGAKDKLGYDERNYRDYARDVAERKNREEQSIKGAITDSKAAEWGSEYAKAQENYMKTPLGRLESAKNTIDSAKDWIANLFNKNEIDEDMMVSRVKATAAYEKIDSEYTDLIEKEREMYKTVTVLTNSPQAALMMDTIKKQGKKYEQVLTDLKKTREKRDAVYAARVELDDKLERMEKKLEASKELLPAEDYKSLEREYRKQMREATDDYYKIVNGK